MDNKQETTYCNIFKTTFLFGFVQVARMLVTLIKNKIVAILLGPSGMGIIGIYSNNVNLIKTGAGLGISQSAVRDVSKANAAGDYDRFSRVITVTHRLVLYTSILGAVVTILLSPFLSKWGFGDNAHILAFIFLAISVAFEVFVENQLAILKGMRQMKSLAKASLIGTIVALATGVPLFFFWGEKGIVPSLIISSISAATVSIYYVSKIKYDKVKVSFKETMKEGSSMVKMGVSMMMSNFLSYLFNMVLLGYIQSKGGLADVGIFNAGSSLVVSYFSMVTNALSTDYYPRIAAISNDNSGLSVELTKQSQVGLLLISPLIIIFVLFSPFFINLLYSSEFESVTRYTDIAIIGTLISVVSNSIGYIFIVKSEAKLYMIFAVASNLLAIPLYILLYKFWGLYGLGIAFTLYVLAQLIVYSVISWRRYRIIPSRGIMLRLLMVTLLTVITVFVRNIGNLYIRYIIGFILIFFSCVYAYLEMKHKMNIDPIQFIKNKYDKK